MPVYPATRYTALIFPVSLFQILGKLLSLLSLSFYFLLKAKKLQKLYQDDGRVFILLKPILRNNSNKLIICIIKEKTLQKISAFTGLEKQDIPAVSL